jgi:protein SCO1/2
MALRVLALRSLIAAAVALAGGASGAGDGPRTSRPVRDGSGGASGGPLADIGPAPEIALVDQAGRPFALSKLRGKVVLVSFVYTTCSGACPATTLAMSRVQKVLREAGLWGSKVEFVSVSLDPARDTSEVLSAYAKVYGADPAVWHFLTGEPGAVARVVAAWGMWARPGPTGALDHPSRVFLVDPRGRQREIYSLEFLAPRAVAKDVQTVLAEMKTTPGA